MNNISIFELEKKILKAQSSDEIDAITEDMDKQQLRNIVKLLTDRYQRVLRIIGFNS